jgi:hypothetical protein
MHPTPAHPPWCQYPESPNDATHAHTAAVGTVDLARDTTVELVLVQTPDSPRPMLTLHVTAPTARLSIDITGVQAWALAGALIDATVQHAQAVSNRQCVESTRPEPSLPPGAERRTRPMWLLDRHPNGRMSRRRTTGRTFRCLPTRPRPDDHGYEMGDHDFGT